MRIFNNWCLFLDNQLINVMDFETFQEQALLYYEDIKLHKEKK